MSEKIDLHKLNLDQIGALHKAGATIDPKTGRHGYGKLTMPKTPSGRAAVKRILGGSAVSTDDHQLTEKEMQMVYEAVELAVSQAFDKVPQVASDSNKTKRAKSILSRFLN